VGIKVYSVNDRCDLIFNDHKKDSENIFDHGVFTGSFGVISKIGEEFHSMLLDKGTIFEHGNMRIEIQGKPGNVLIKKLQEGFEIDSPQPFILTIPLNEEDDGVFETLGQDEKKTFKGKVIQKDKIKLATFELPALDRVNLKLL